MYKNETRRLREAQEALQAQSEAEGLRRQLEVERQTVRELQERLDRLREMLATERQNAEEDALTIHVQHKSLDEYAQTAYGLLQRVRELEAAMRRLLVHFEDVNDWSSENLRLAVEHAQEVIV